MKTKKSIATTLCYTSYIKYIAIQLITKYCCLLCIEIDGKLPICIYNISNRDTYWGKPHTPFRKDVIQISKMKKQRQLNIRLYDNDYEKIISRAKKYNMSITDYILQSTTKEKVLVIEDGKEMLKNIIYELNKIGTNLNQQSKLAYHGSITVIKYDFEKEFNKIWQFVSFLSQKVEI